ncbi:SDR family NAD(P)-dependent oxidoreductase [Endozoicomonadaceae bacterium StTr2]
MLKRVLVTGANAGLGKECAKQLADQEGIETIYLGCRNQQKALQAKAELEQVTGKQIFEILLMDVSDTDSVRQAVSQLEQPVDGLVMNAGGSGGHNFKQLTKEGVINIAAVNLLGHVVLINELIKAKKLTQVAVYSGSEGSRGVKEMGMKRPKLANYSTEEFISICDGSYFENENDPMVIYNHIKLIGAFWISALARQHPEIKFITISPGLTAGTQGAETLPILQKTFMKTMMWLMVLFGKAHRADFGARRYLEGLYNQNLKSGVFYASKKGLSGEIDEQRLIFPELDNEEFQDNARQALNYFIGVLHKS